MQVQCNIFVALISHFVAEVLKICPAIFHVINFRRDVIQGQLLPPYFLKLCVKFYLSLPLTPFWRFSYDNAIKCLLPPVWSKMPETKPSPPLQMIGVGEGRPCAR